MSENTTTTAPTRADQVRFVYEGVEVTMVTRPMFAELAWVERNSGIDADEMTSSEASAANTLISLRRAGFMLKWSDVMAMSPGDFRVVQDEPAAPPAVEGEAAAEVPTAAGPEAGEPPAEPTSADVLEAPPAPADDAALAPADADPSTASVTVTG